VLRRRHLPPHLARAGRQVQSLRILVGLVNVDMVDAEALLGEVDDRLQQARRLQHGGSGGAEFRHGLQLMGSLFVLLEQPQILQMAAQLAGDRIQDFPGSFRESSSRQGSGIHGQLADRFVAHRQAAAGKSDGAVRAGFLERPH
jgi:hypothetical protein